MKAKLCFDSPNESTQSKEPTKQCKSYVRLDFKKIRLRNGVYEGTKTTTMDAAEYEKYSKLKNPLTFEELYYATNIQRPSDILTHFIKMNKSLVEHELMKLMLAQLEYGRLPSYDVTFSRGAYKTAISNLLKKYESFRQFLDCGDFDYELLPQVLELDDGEVILKNHFLLLQKLYARLQEKENRGLLHLVVGAPGTGKTQYVSDSIFKLLANPRQDAVKVVTLSNLAGNNMRGRLTRNNVRNVVCSSYAREHFVRDEEQYKAVIFEEASMLTMAEVPIMISAIEHAEHCYITGDCNQLPGFLGMGNILYAITSEFGIEKELVRNHRCSEEVVRSMNAILAGRLPNVVPQSELLNILQALFSKEKESSFIITCFTNAMAEKLNLLAMSVKMDTDALPFLSANNKDQALLELTGKFLEKFKEMPCICRKQIVEEVIEDNRVKYIQRFFTSERGIARLTDDGRVVVSSIDVSGHYYEYDTIEHFLWAFAPGFACTIYKAQGLEWDYAVLWNDMNDFNRSSNACYVAYTRSRKKSIVLSDDSVSGAPIEYRNVFRFAAHQKEE